MKNQMINYFAFAVLALLWLGFGAALVFNQELLNTVWQLFLGWPLIGQLVVGLLTLPVIVGLWIWHTPLPIWLRLILVIGLAGATVFMFFPKKAPGQPVTAQAKS